MNRRVVIGLLAVVVAIAVIAVVWSSRNTPPAAAPSTSASPAATHTEPVAESASPAASKPLKIAIPTPDARASPAHALPDWTASLDDAYPQLREYAEAGDAEAGIELSRRLSNCTPHALKAAKETERQKLAMIEEDKTDDRLTDELRGQRARNVRQQIVFDAKAHEGCEHIPPDVRADWLRWIDQAARSGNTSAMVEYASDVRREYDSVESVLADPDAAIERRDKAGAYLIEAAARGETDALSALAFDYSRVGSTAHVVASDASLAYAYAYAATLAGAPRGADLDSVMTHSAAKLDGRQLAAAEAEGKRLYEACCAKH